MRVFIDRDLRSAARLSFHPNVNTVTVTIGAADFERYLAARANAVQYIDA